VIRSLSTAVAVVSLIVLVVCLFSARAISKRTEEVYFQPIFQTMDRIELQDARSALERGGIPELRKYFARLDTQFGGQHLLLDRNGRDIDGGADHTASLPAPPLDHSRGELNGVHTITQRSDDGQYWFVALRPAAGVVALSFRRFYLLITAVVLILGLFSTAYIVLPLRRMAATVESFGIGNMKARIQNTRSDEIGALAKSYNHMADRLEAAFTRERQLLQDMSHELRAPLTRLNFSTQLARTASDRDLAMDEIKRDLDRLAFLVSELTTLSLGPPGGLGAEAQRSPVDLEAIVLEAVHDCELEAQAKGSIIACTGSAPELICGEAEHIRRAIGNVLRNAVRHSPEDSPIDIALYQTPDWSSIIVRDYGPGVPRELLDRIFDPFFQVDPARSATQNGLGLGLSIAKRSVEMHNGTIEAQNTSPGLKVSIRLPHPRPAAPPKDHPTEVLVTPSVV
jgi:signal transduction histidine kinase